MKRESVFSLYGVPFMTVSGRRKEFLVRTPAPALKGQRGMLAHYWWVILFVFACGGVYLNAAHKKEEILTGLQNQQDRLLREKELAMRLNEDLSLQINSQSDPEWIQLTLMKGLGLVPEGYLKVYFYDQGP